MEAKLQAFLFELRCNEAPHSGRTLFDHLKGVHDLLRDWGNDEEVCNAGLLHSIYGTKAYGRVSIRDRRPVRELIGDYAEQLVHNFRTLDRPLFESVQSKKMRSQLMEIEAANLIEQGGGRKALQKLTRQKISNGAKAAIAMELSQ